MRTQPTPRYHRVINTGPLEPCVKCGEPTNLGFIVRGKDLGKDVRICSELCADKVYAEKLYAEAAEFERKKAAGAQARRATIDALA